MESGRHGASASSWLQQHCLLSPRLARWDPAGVFLRWANANGPDRLFEINGQKVDWHSLPKGVLVWVRVLDGWKGKWRQPWNNGNLCWPLSWGPVSSISREGSGPFQTFPLLGVSTPGEPGRSTLPLSQMRAQSRRRVNCLYLPKYAGHFSARFYALLHLRLQSRETQLPTRSSWSRSGDPAIATKWDAW